ncbi:hypothetical protein ACFE04_012423 [Oxalis oulophora]
MKAVISIFKSRTMKLHTTRSWDFMALNPQRIRQTTSLSSSSCHDTVVGIIDSGIWPESESFQEEVGMGPIPETWRGKCVKGDQFEPLKHCNRKLIGARFYLRGYEQRYGSLISNTEYRSARDFLGHGTHTASIAVGSIVNNASFLGIGQGIARGGAPRARLAVYKVCWGTNNYNVNCGDDDILAAFDDALHDGVNVISVSLGLSPPLAPFFASTTDIASFHAMQLGVTVVFSAGNDGPDPSMVLNVNPWSISVAASSIDRTFPTEITLNSNFYITGQSLVTKEFKGKLADSRDYFDNGQIPDVNFIPTVQVDYFQGTLIRNYLTPLKKLPVIQITPSQTVIGRSPAPVVAYFSSRGPSSLSPDFLKPDISAPGVNILAAWPPHTPPSLDPTDNRSVLWNFLSGTSMSCPHVSGVAALLKSVHPNWCPAAIRSALMTTAYTKDTTRDSILSGGTTKGSDPFDIGAGHIDPSEAMDPGLVYETNPNDYVLFLCNSGYTQEQINIILLPSPSLDTRCIKKSTNDNINYPSITLSNLQSTTKIKRSVRNVGQNKNAIYFATLVKPHGVEVKVWPKVLIFSCWKEQLTYYVTFTPLKESQGRYDFGEIIWSDGFHNVRSPLVVQVNSVNDNISKEFNFSTHAI